MSEESLPLRQWPAGIRQASVPANENALRVQALLSRALSVENDAPGTEYNGAVYIVGSAPTGAFSTFSEHDIALFEFGSWYAWAPPLDTSMVINDVRKVFDGTEWVDDPSLSDYVPTSRTISTTAPLTGGGDLTVDRTIGISAATTSAAGSMSGADKTKLDGIATGATLGATWGTNLSGIPANITAWEAVAPSEFVSTSGAQAGISGAKGWTGSQTYTGVLLKQHSNGLGLTIERTGSAVNSSIEYKTTGGSIYAGMYSATSWRVAASLNLSLSTWFEATATAAYVAGNPVWHAGNMPLASGTYTPTATGVANVASHTTQVHSWMRVGNSVTMSGRIDVVPSVASTFTQIRIALPVPSNFASGMDVSGALTWNVSTAELGAGFVSADATNDQILLNFICGSVANHGLRYSVTYPVLP